MTAERLEDPQGLTERRHRVDLQVGRGLGTGRVDRVRVVGDEEDGGPGPLHGHRLLLETTDVTDAAVGSDGAAGGDGEPPGQTAPGQAVDDAEGPGQAGRRTADLVGVDRDGEGK